MSSIINDTIKNNGLVGGMPMKDIAGKDIPSSVVVDNYTWAYFDEDSKRVRILKENAITGEETEINLSPESFSTLQNCSILEIPS